MSNIPERIHLEGDRLRLRRVELSDATEEYVEWLNDKEINQFLESRFTHYDLQMLKDYIGKISADPSTIFLAIIRKEDGKHIGNIKLGPISWHHRVGDIGIMIGDRSAWGKGYASEAISLLSDFAFNVLKLHKLTAGSYANNIGSIKAFLKVGFHEEGKRKKHFRTNDGYTDNVLMAKFRE